MRYVSTRGGSEIKASEALLAGLAPNGGLYVPVEINKLKFEYEGKNYTQITRNILELFFADLPVDILKSAVENMVSLFKNPLTIPLVKKGDLHYLELFHGPTLAFKDVALSILPKLLQKSAEIHSCREVAILTATSGDTGSAAMCGFSGVAGTKLIAFYPQIGTSEIQHRQMVCQTGVNVSACAIEGNFDDAQSAVKSIFMDRVFVENAQKNGISLSSANSINIGRLFPQMSYYFYAAEQLENKIFDVVVPSGNFGNILAAWYAKKLGCPIRRFIVASNENNVLAKFIKTGIYDATGDFKITNSPSMDILVSSNLERLVFELTNRNSLRLSELMKDLKEKRKFSLNEDEFKVLSHDFFAGFANETEIEKEIKNIFVNEKYLVDPHTAVGVKVGKEFLKLDENVPMIITATASPWKFPKTMLKALSGKIEENDFISTEELEIISGEKSPIKNILLQEIIHKNGVAKNEIKEEVCRFFEIK